MIKSFPAVVFVARFGRLLAVVCSVICVAALPMLGLLDLSRSGVALIAIIGAVVWGLLRLFAELIEVVADTLLPR